MFGPKRMTSLLFVGGIVAHLLNLGTIQLDELTASVVASRGLLSSRNRPVKRGNRSADRHRVGSRPSRRDGLAQTQFGTLNLENEGGVEPLVRLEAGHHLRVLVLSFEGLESFGQGSNVASSKPVPTLQNDSNRSSVSL